MFIKFIWNLAFISLFLSSVNAAAKTDIFQENCGDFPADIKSFRPLSDILSDIFSGSAQNNPLRQIENCLLQTMDEGLKPICDEEKLLKQKLREGNLTAEDLEEINEELVHLEDVKYAYADILYEVAGGTDKFVDVTISATKFDVLSNVLIIDKKIRGIFKDIVRIKALNLCGSTLERTAEEGV